MSFAEYSALIERLVDEGSTTGPKQSESLAGFTKLNWQRMKRLSKTVTIEQGVSEAVGSNPRPMTWLTITEAWCGDAAQNIPIIEKIAAESGIIETRYILRDENPELIDRFLTYGARSIPKLISLDAETLEVLGEWGARPAMAQKLFFEMRERGVEKLAIMEALLISSWSGRKNASAGA
jgi:Thioredoxin